MLVSKDLRKLPNTVLIREHVKHFPPSVHAITPSILHSKIRRSKSSFSLAINDLVDIFEVQKFDSLEALQIVHTSKLTRME